MHYRRLGTSGLQLSALSFGAWVTFGKQVGRSQARELLALAHDRGVNFFDNAETYNNGVAEQVMGDVLADLRFPRDSLLRLQQGVFRRGGRSAADPARAVAQACDRGLPPGAAATAGGISGPVFLPSARSGHADRRDRGGDGYADPPGQGAVLGHQRVAGRGDPRGAPRRPREPLLRAGGGTAAVQPAASRAGGAGVRAAVRGLRHGHHDLVAAVLRAC